MSAEKKIKKTAKAAEKDKPAPQPANAAEQPEASPLPLSAVDLVESKPGPPVAGICASAGGLDAFKRFFGAMPADSGVAFVLIPHLDPNHESLMVELLTRCTKMPVVEATEGSAVEANCVSILPPNQYMTIADGVLHLTGPVERGGLQTSIDLFLRSLAEDKKEKGICIILSGTGSHGSLGLKAVKAADGMAMVQDPSTAEYPSMPLCAIATGLADYVLPVEKMPEALTKYIQHSYVNDSKAGAEAIEDSDQLHQVMALLRARTKFDFRCYRKRLLVRRIERRMSLGHVNALADYLVFLRGHPDEVKRLFRDLLISVTNFFRDPDAFRSLETEVLAPLIDAKPPDAALRIWSAGCATGEEAYSLAMMVIEQLGAGQKLCRLQIFASDVDENALEVARQGIYPESIAADVSSERLTRFCTRVDDVAYRVSKQLRESVVFARQNVITDAPFSKLDLIVCRNLLIYLEPEVQKKVIALLHFALNDGGYLFLGPSETVGRNIDLFEPVSKKWRVFRRTGPARPERVEIPIAAALDPLMAARRLSSPNAARPVRFVDLMQRLLVDEFAPAAVLINGKFEILCYSGPTDRYLAFAPGEPTQDLMTLLREGLRAKLRSALRQGPRDNLPVTLADAKVKRNGDYHAVTVTIHPVADSQGARGLLLVTFQDSDRDPPAPRVPESATEETVVRQLEQELKATKEDLQGAIEELEGSNEQFKLANEEAMSMNEEFQSTNEELETSKEELQSLNEELSTVNNQLQDKVADLERANNDMANFLNCTDVAILFLDNRFRIKRFTAPAVRLFNLIATDLGRPIGDITPKFADGTFQQDVEHVLQTMTPREKLVRTADGCDWNRRIALYRTLDHRIEGVVLTFTDVTQIRRADERERRLAAVLLDSNDALTVHDFAGKITAWNRGAERMFGYSEAEALQMNVAQLLPEESLGQIQDYWEQLQQVKSVHSWEARRRTKDGRVLNVWVTVTGLKDETGQLAAIAKTERDMTDRKNAEAALQESETRMRLFIENAPAAIAMFDSAMRYLAVSRRWSADYQLTDNILGRSHLEVFPEMPEKWKEVHRRALAGEIIRSAADCFHRANGTTQWLKWEARPWFRDDGAVGGTMIATEDVTEHKMAEQNLNQLKESLEMQVAERTKEVLEREARLRAILQGAADAIITFDAKGIIQSVNPATERMFGHRAAETIGKSFTSLVQSLDWANRDDNWAKYAKKAVIGREAVAQRKDRSAFPVELTVSKVAQFDLFTGIIRDISRRKELEREVVEIVSLEQRRIGQDLHDSVGQELTALSIRAADLTETRHTDPSSGSELIEQMAQGLQRCQRELRDVMRGLLPVAVDAEGLMAALSDLADRFQADGKATCKFECFRPVAIEDNLAATHLYLIVQEAVRNAIKHAQPSRILISLEWNDGLLLRVQDDGIGMPAQPTVDQGGLGLRIMRNRAAIIGATLTIERAEPTGTLVTCFLPGKNDENKQ